MNKPMNNTIKRFIGRIIRGTYRRIFYQYSRLYGKLAGLDSLNIGGGPNFIAPGWMNMEVVKSFVNPNPFELTADAGFPLKDGSVRIAYTSHCLEHLDAKTVQKVLSEVSRVLKRDGHFVIKLPDFDRVLDAWRRSESGFFSSEFWGYDSVVGTWASRRVSDCLDCRAAMIFCGFWNSSYGDHFAEKISTNEKAYHGPAVADVEFIRKLKNGHTPSQISAILSKVVIENEKDYRFNHRSAWSRKELEGLLIASGFQVVTLEKSAIISEFSRIPGIRLQERQSMYCWAKKVSQVIDSV